MGFIEYARSQSFEKDILKQRIILDRNLKYPRLEYDFHGSVLFLPQPNLKEEQISFLGYTYPDNDHGKVEIARLFKSMVSHLSAHTVTSNYNDFRIWKQGKNDLLSKFVPSLIEDLMVHTYITAWYPDRVGDISQASAMSLLRMRNLDTISVSSTRLMTSLLIYGNIGLRLEAVQDRGILSQIFNDIDEYKTLLEDAIINEDLYISKKKIDLTDSIYSLLLKNGPIIEAPALPFTEYYGPHSLFPEMIIPPSLNMDDLTHTCLTSLGGSKELFSQSLYKLTESEALQVFESQLIDDTKEASIIKKYDDYMNLSRFKDIEFPRQDQTAFRRAKSRSKREAYQFTEILNSINNSDMENFEKRYGILDLSEVIQVVASKSERTDVFLRDDKMVKSYAWAIVIDSSRSMQHLRDYALESTIAINEAASNFLLDHNCWGVYAFNENLQIIKDFRESYNTRVRSRIGGLVFEGATYLPDAVEVVGSILRKRPEELKIMFVISDGQPFGYSNIFMTTSEVVNRMQDSEMIIIGIGLQSNNVEYIFKNHVTSYNLKDTVKDIGRIYLAKSEEY